MGVAKAAANALTEKNLLKIKKTLDKPLQITYNQNVLKLFTMEKYPSGEGAPLLRE